MAKKTNIYLGASVLIFILILCIFYIIHRVRESFTDENEKPRIALLLRGHIRNTLENQELYDFINQLTQNANIDLYVCTWIHLEAKSSYRQLDESKQNKELIISQITDYFKDLNLKIKTIDIQNDEDCKINGRIDGKLTDVTNMPILGWKRMLWNMNRGMQLINDDIPYKFVLNMRLDMFNIHQMNSENGFGKNKIIDWVNSTLTKPIEKIIFLRDTEFFGVDNIYIGNKEFLRSFLNSMTTNLDEKLPEYKDLIYQEFIFFREAQKHTV